MRAYIRGKQVSAQALGHRVDDDGLKDRTRMSSSPLCNLDTYVV